jgi:hypothetical protein
MGHRSIKTTLRYQACILPNVTSPLDPESQNMVVRQMEQGKAAEALQILEDLAAKGDDLSMVQLGLYHYQGTGVKQDYTLEYMTAYLEAKGQLKGIPEGCRPIGARGRSRATFWGTPATSSLFSGDGNRWARSSSASSRRAEPCSWSGRRVLFPLVSPGSLLQAARSDL